MRLQIHLQRKIKPLKRQAFSIDPLQMFIENSALLWYQRSNQVGNKVLKQRQIKKTAD